MAAAAKAAETEEEQQPAASSTTATAEAEAPAEATPAASKKRKREEEEAVEEQEQETKEAVSGSFNVDNDMRVCWVCLSLCGRVAACERLLRLVPLLPPPCVCCLVHSWCSSVQLCVCLGSTHPSFFFCVLTPPPLFLHPRPHTHNSPLPHLPPP